MFPLDSDVNTKAVILKRKGSSSQAFEIGDIELPHLKQDEILIKNQAFGLNYADVMARNGLYRDAPPMPCVIGYCLLYTSPSPRDLLKSRMPSSA